MLRLVSDTETTQPGGMAGLLVTGSGLFGSTATDPVKAPAATPPPSKFTRPADVRSNRYAAACVACGERVEADKGILDKDANGKWVVTHAGACPEVPDRPEAAPEAPGALPEGPPVWPGIYTIHDEHGHRTFKVRYQPMDADFAPGETILEYLSGSDNEHDYTSFGFIKPGPRLVVWKRYRDNDSLVEDAENFLADPAAALESKNCIVCNATLSVPSSVELGMGPTCAKRWADGF